MKLYELSENFNNLYELIHNEEVPLEVVEEALSEIEDSIEDKFENTAKLIKHFEGVVSVFKKEEHRLKARRQVYENRIKSIKGYLLNQLEFMERTKIDANTFTVRKQQNPPSIDLNEQKLDEKYLIPQPPKPDKKLIKEDMDSGLEVEGASYKPKSHHLRIQ